MQSIQAAIADPVGSIEAILKSTKPWDSPKERTYPSDRSVATPDARFGQASHSVPFESSDATASANVAASSDTVRR